MNNWRLLLLAIAAVFQPIASFTDHNLIDGRQQCCDRLSSAPLRDSRSSLHGTLHRLNDRDEIHKDRRYELVRQRNPVFSRPSKERPLVENRERGTRQDPSAITKSSRVDFRLERAANSQSRERLLDAHQKEGTARHIRDLNPLDFTRRVADRTSRDALELRDGRIYTESSRDSLFRDDYRTERIGDERLSKNLFDSQRETQRGFRSGDRRITVNRDAPRITRIKDGIASIEDSHNMNDRHRIARERLSVVRRETSIRADTRRYSQNDEPRYLQRNSEQRRSLSENARSPDRIRDMRIRLNAREDNRENQERISTNQRLSTERFDERRIQREDRRESRQQIKENTDRRASGERMQMNQRMTRESQIMNEINAQNERNVDDRWDIRHNERMARNIQNHRENLDHRRSRGRTDRRNMRESRFMNTQNNRDVDGRREIRRIGKMSREARGEIREHLVQQLSREKILIDRRDTRESRNTNTLNERDVDNRQEIRYNERLSRDSRDNHNIRLSLEWNQIDRGNIRELRVMNNLVNRDDRRVDSKRAVMYNNRVSRETQDENRVNTDHRLASERIQMERRNIREFRTLNDKNDDSQRELRYNKERSSEIRKEIRQNAEQRISRERIQMDRRNIREFKEINNVVIRNERDVESRREIRNDARLHTENRENPNHRLARERIQLNQRNTRESRIVNTLNEINPDSRQEIRNERLSRETRDAKRVNADRGPTRERRQVDRRNIRESRIITRTERDIENRREVRYNERLSRQIREDQFTRERRVESRLTGRIIAEEKQNMMMDRRARSTDRRNLRNIRAEPRLSRSAEAERRNVFLNRVEHSQKVENREREAIDTRFRSLALTRNRERISSVIIEKTEPENDLSVANWQYVLYTLQAAYLCALFMQMLTPSHAGKPHKMSLRWLPVSSHYNPIKVD